MGRGREKDMDRDQRETETQRNRQAGGGGIDRESRALTWWAGETKAKIERSSQRLRE